MVGQACAWVSWHWLSICGLWLGLVVRLCGRPWCVPIWRGCRLGRFGMAVSVRCLCLSILGSSCCCGRRCSRVWCSANRIYCSLFAPFVVFGLSVQPLGGCTCRACFVVVKCITALPHSAGRVALRLRKTSAISSVMLVNCLPHLISPVGAYVGACLLMVVCFSLGCL